MRLLFLLPLLFLLSACRDTAEVDTSHTEAKSITQIQSTKTEAQQAQDEYKRLQAQRVNE
jgi:cell division protein FtsL